MTDRSQSGVLSSDTNTGHGHVYPRPDGVKARCGGPGICSECASALARKQHEASTAKDVARASNPNNGGWLIERLGHPGIYFSPGWRRESKWEWITTDPNEAVRFVRQEDANRAKAMFHAINSTFFQGTDWVATEHVWLEAHGNETPEQLLSQLTDAQREQATENLLTIINVSSALEKKTPKELVDLVLGELAAMDVSSAQELLIEELCTRVHPNWCNEDPTSAKATEQCSRCGGTGLSTTVDGDIDQCNECGGNTVVPVQASEHA